MLRNYLKIAWRNLYRNKLYSLINIGGLAVGLAGFIVILLYLNYELSYDRWDKSLEKVYKISARSDEDIHETTAAPLAGFLKENSPEIVSSTAVIPNGDYEIPISSGEKVIYQKGGAEVDSNFLKVFPYKISAGNAAKALQKPNAIIISKELSLKLFGGSNPIGKTVKLFNVSEYEITAVMEEPDGPSHLNIQFFCRNPYEMQNMHWENFSYHTYIKTKEVVAVEKLENAINKLYYDKRLKNGNQPFEEFRRAGHRAGLFVDAVKDLHNFPKYGSSNFITVSALLVLAAMLLVAGAINFSNLSIAASIRRTKEVGLRKVLGSGRQQLFWQFMGEVALQCMISLSVATLLVNVALPYFNREFNISLSFFQSGNVWLITSQITICLLLVIALSGLYPAIFLAYINVTNVLKGIYSSGTKGMRFRNVLIVIQFVVAAFFIFGTLTINRQMHFMQIKDKGFSGEQVMRIQTTQKTRDTNFEATKIRLLNLPGVQHVSKSTAVPGDRIADTSTVLFKNEGKEYRMASVKVSSDYFKTLQIDLLRGRMFDNRYTDENTRSAIINESAVRKMSIADPVGKTITFPFCDSIPVQIIGVVKDFNVAGFETTVLPVVYTIGNEACMFQSGGAMLVKLNSKNIPQLLSSIEKVWKDIEPGLPIRYSFLDENFQKLFTANIRLQSIISFFAITAILISVMGLFALTAFLTNQRSKEIGIRKVLGAGVAQVISLLSKDFIRLILIAICIAAPLGYWAATKWLESFSYRISVSWQVFTLTAFIVLLIGLVTISLQTIKAALANPVESLRTE